MAAGTASKVSDDFGIASDRNKAIAFALFKRHSVDPNKYASGSIENSDIASLFSNIVCLSDHQVPLSNEHEIMKWVTFASSFPNDGDACLPALEHLNEDLNLKSVLLGDGLKPSEADIVVFSAVHSCVSCLADMALQQFPNVFRWMDFIQDKEDFGGVFTKIVVDKPEFIPIEIAKKKNSGVSKANAPSEKDSGANEKKKKTLEKETAEKDAESNISILNIQIGIILKASKHPSADSLLVEEIDLGDGNLRQVVSGLAKFHSPEDLVNRRVVLVTNVKPGKLRDIMSAGLVLCASNEDHTVVEPLIPPEGALLGERVSFLGYDGKPEDVLNPKKKQLEKITPHLYTNEEGVATFKGIAFMTSAGPCKSSITKHLDIELEKDDDDANKNNGFSREQWKEALNRFKVEALKAKAVSVKAYEVYSKKIIEMLMDKAEKLKIQADSAQKDLSILAQEISKEGQEYLSATEKNYPHLIKEIMEVYASLDEITTFSSIREFYLGIPYGCFLSIGGFLYFMLTGSIPAIRFGVILGTAILALSVSSMRSWKNGKTTPLLLVGQIAISSIIFLKQWRLCSQMGLFSNRLMLLISGAMLGFYVYRIASDFNKSAKVERSSET